MSDDVVSNLIRTLDLAPHPEGGFFRETYRAAGTIPSASLPDAYDGDRAYATAILYLITKDGGGSMLHRIRSDEVFHFYAGDMVEHLQLRPDGSSLRTLLGPHVASGERPQLVVTAGAWQGCRVNPFGSWALLGCTVAPGFDFADFELAERDALLAQFPDHEDEIRALTREGRTPR